MLYYIIKYILTKDKYKIKKYRYIYNYYVIIM